MHVAVVDHTAATSTVMEWMVYCNAVHDTGT